MFRHHQCRSLLQANFPPKLYALPHVMEQIWRCLLSLQESVMETSKANDLEWLKQLLAKEDCDVSDAVIYNASQGKMEAVKLLLPYMHEDWGFELKEGMWQTLETAIDAASEHAQIDIVRLLLLKEDENDEIVWKVISTAAKKGNIDMLHVATEIVDTLFGGTEKDQRAGVLLQAILTGQTAAATYLINRYYREWSLADALEFALVCDLSAVADCMYEAVAVKEGYRESVEDFYVYLTDDGHLEALKYMYNRGLDNSKLVGNAFVSAGRSNEVQAMKMLLDTDKVSDQAFKDAFWYASRNGKKEAVVFLCASKRVSAEAITFAFESAGSLAISELLYKKLQNPVEATKTAFRNATCLGRGYIYRFMLAANRIAVVKFLISTGHVPAESIVEAFLSAHRICHFEIVKALVDEPCISVQIAREALQRATDNGQAEIAELLANKLRGT
ncbi:hypothetical protein PF010_g15778 [Phytophthora fragariae]|uniref:Uncharacterized protein n=2 Tax=Phytophthora fragariae TaxID=53985 RepID=A0A6G0KSY5_9STRA|nr:hypothetical protein PF010_g15778 [Phytophthora fragariae]